MTQHVQPGEIFVFGSNREGRHGKGAALFAREFCGAVYGRAEGLQGRSYAIVTKELRTYRAPVLYPELAAGVGMFLLFARRHPELKFYVSPIGCGLAGYDVAEIAPLFADAAPNVRLCSEFAEYLECHP